VNPMHECDAEGRLLERSIQKDGRDRRRRAAPGGAQCSAVLLTLRATRMRSRSTPAPLAGVNFVTRKVGNSIKNYEEWSIAGDEWNMAILSTFKDRHRKFKIGQEFDDETLDGRQVKVRAAVGYWQRGRARAVRWQLALCGHRIVRQW